MDCPSLHFTNQELETTEQLLPRPMKIMAVRDNIKLYHREGIVQHITNLKKQIGYGIVINWAASFHLRHH